MLLAVVVGSVEEPVSCGSFESEKSIFDKLRYSNHFPSRSSPLNVRGQSVKAASLSRIEAASRLAAGPECGSGGGGVAGGGGGGVGARPGYGYEALSAASDGSEAEPEDVPEYAAFEMELSAGGESADGPSSRGSTKVNFPPEVELERRATATSTTAAYHKGRGRSMSAWSDISRSSIRFEERFGPKCYIVTDCCAGLRNSEKVMPL
ncbi:unnamed protein product [Chilo suppressalis]|uniref:Uncharacterized protein n=1 Tax=Chilo suppressalis TaxID=168631 RepID=A0ABN8B6J6_CHISP|nr:unnamed protein product [Chilo suppressalis]